MCTIPFQLYQVEGFPKLVELFKSNFEKGEEVGASITILQGGKSIVELSGGYANFEDKTPYQKDTVQAVYSSSKAVTALVISYLVDQGLLDYDATVATYWPEFGQNNKDKVTLKDILRHQAGVAWLEPVITYEDVVNRDKLRQAIERQPHNFDGEPKRCYHAITRGFALNEIVSRVDPKKRTIAKILEDEFNIKFGTEFYYGIRDPEIMKRNSIWYDDPSAVWHLKENSVPEGTPKYSSQPPFSELPPIMKVISVPTHRDLKITGAKVPEFHDIEIPSVNGHTTASSLARLLSLMVTSQSPISATTRKLAIEESLKVKDEALEIETILTKGGFMKYEYPDLNVEVYGGGGMGGSLVIFHPESELTFAYVMNGRNDYWAWYGRGYEYFKAFYQDYKKNVNDNGDAKI